MKVSTIIDKMIAWWNKKIHKCMPIKYSETGETIIFHWDIPWCFFQTFTVCDECKKVKVLSEVRADNRAPLGGYRKEKDGQEWSGNCDYGKTPSIGRDKLRISFNQKG